MLTEVRLPVAMALLLILASWLRGRILALLTLGHRGPRITATQELLLSTFNALQATGTSHLCPVLCDVPVLVLVFFELLVFLFGIFSMGNQERV
jgi:hypothetical protein